MRKEVGEPDPSCLTPPDVAGSAELATQTALDLLLNMSTQRELTTSSLQVGKVKGSQACWGLAQGGFPALFCRRVSCRALPPWLSCCIIQVAVVKPDDPGETPGPCELQAQEEEEEAKVDSKEQQQKLVMLHMTEPGQTLVQEAYGEASLSGSELQQITIPFSGTAEYSIIAPISEEIQAPATLYRSAVREDWGGGGTSDLQLGGFSGEEEADCP